MPTASTVTAVNKPTHATVLGNLIISSSFLVVHFGSVCSPFDIRGSEKKSSILTRDKRCLIKHILHDIISLMSYVLPHISC